MNHEIEVHKICEAAKAAGITHINIALRATNGVAAYTATAFGPRATCQRTHADLAVAMNAAVYASVHAPGAAGAQ